MRRLILADVHASLPAFEAVLHDAGRVDEVVFLGDVVGYGPHPAECVELLQSLGARAIAGNHDLTAIDASKWESRHAPPPQGRPDWEAWTRAQLEGHHRAFLASLPAHLAFASCGAEALAIHHPEGAPYLHPDMPPDRLGSYFAHLGAPLIYCGHSHRRIDCVAGGRRIVCLPPVGQPRDGDPRAGYLLEEDDRLTARFVPYDVAQVVRDVKAIGLEPAFVERWVRFLRTAHDPEWSRPAG